jgi:glycerol-3-phosphate O-acyltransferase
VFVPVGINYDRVFEDRTLVRDLNAQSERRGRAYAVFKSLGFVLHNLSLAARRRWHRFGYAGVRVGEPVFLRDYLNRHAIDFRAMSEAQAFAAVERLGSELMAHVGRAIPVLPVSLVATVMVESSEPLSEFELKGRVLDLVARLAARGAHVHVPRADQDYAVQVGLRMLTLRRLVQEDEAGLYAARKTELTLLRYYANAIGHLLDEEDPSPGERKWGHSEFVSH